MSDPVENEKFVYGSVGLSARDRWIQRFFEIIPGAASWGILLGMAGLSWIRPVPAIASIIAFDLLWIFFLGYATCLMIASVLRVRIERDTDWMMRLRHLDGDGSAADQREPRPRQFFRRLSQQIHFYHLRMLRNLKIVVPSSESIYHVIIVSISNESREKIESLVGRLLTQDFPLDRVMVILAAHEGAPRSVKQVAWDLHRKHFERFAAFYVAPHPTAEGNQRPVKGAAVNFAARMAATAFEKEGIDPSRVVVSCLEASSYPSPNYLACLTWKFLVCPDRERVCFQPVPVYHPNIWKASAPANLLHIGSSFLHRIEATDPEGLISLASYSMSLKTLIDAGFWPDEQQLSGDSTFFWKAFLEFDGRFRTILTTATISQDIVDPDTFKNTIQSVYHRKKRDAEAIRNLPIILRGFLQKDGISLLTKLRHASKLLLKQVGAATWFFLLLVIGWFPGLVASLQAPNSSLSYYAPRIHALVGMLGLIALTAAAVLSALQLPRRDSESMKRWELLRHLWAWIVLPPLALLLTAFPFLAVQTLLMLGKSQK